MRGPERLVIGRKWEVGAFFGGVGPGSSDEDLRRSAPDHPAFRLDD